MGAVHTSLLSKNPKIYIGKTNIHEFQEVLTDASGNEWS